MPLFSLHGDELTSFGHPSTKLQLFPEGVRFLLTSEKNIFFFFGGVGGRIVSTRGDESSRPDGPDLSSSSQGDSTHATFHNGSHVAG